MTGCCLLTRTGARHFCGKGRFITAWFAPPCPPRAGVSTGLKGNQFRRPSGIPFGQCVPASNTPAFHLDQRCLTLASCTPMRLGLTQDKQLPTGAPNRRGNVGAQRTRWRSRANPMAGSWSLAAYPRSYRPVSPNEKLPAFSPHSVGRSTRRNRRLGESPQMMIKRQEESSPVSLCAMSGD